AALKEEVTSPVVTDDEDDVALQFLAFGGQFAQVDAAGPIFRDGDLRSRFPAAFAQSFLTDFGVGLRCTLKWAEVQQMPAAFAAIVTQAVQVDREGRRRVCADHDGERLARPNTGVGAIAFDPGAAIFRLWIDASVLEHPLRGAGLLVLFTD